MGIICSSIEEAKKEYNEDCERRKQFLNSLRYYNLRDFQKHFNNQTNLPRAIMEIKPYVNYSSCDWSKKRIGEYSSFSVSNHYIVEHLFLSIGRFDQAKIAFTEQQCIALGIFKEEKNN